MTGSGQKWINEVWYGKRLIPALLLTPLSWIYRGIVAVRRTLFRTGLLRSTELSTPVIVVGNLTVGGTGKTPITIWLVDELAARGCRVGVVSRGYGGSGGGAPLPVHADGDPAVVGDEPVLIARRCGCPVVVHRDRVAAARVLEEQGVDMIVTDDGLQHYALARQIEIAVVDASRGFGNRRMLPAGPLREPLARLREVDRILLNVSTEPDTQLAIASDLPVQQFRLAVEDVQQLGGDETRKLSEFSGQRVHAVAAIGNPQRFFDLLQRYRIDVIPHPLPDHASIGPGDVRFDDGLAVLMTEKDAVKCRHQPSGNIWYVPVSAEVDDASWVDGLATTLRSSAC